MGLPHWYIPYQPQVSWLLLVGRKFLSEIQWHNGLNLVLAPDCWRYGTPPPHTHTQTIGTTIWPYLGHNESVVMIGDGWDPDGPRTAGMRTWLLGGRGLLRTRPLRRRTYMRINLSQHPQPITAALTVALREAQPVKYSRPHARKLPRCTIWWFVITPGRQLTNAGGFLLSDIG